MPTTDLPLLPFRQGDAPQRVPVPAGAFDRFGRVQRGPTPALATFRRKIRTSCSRFKSQLLRKTASSDGFEVDCGGRR